MLDPSTNFFWESKAISGKAQKFLDVLDCSVIEQIEFLQWLVTFSRKILIQGKQVVYN